MITNHYAKPVSCWLCYHKIIILYLTDIGDKDGLHSMLDTQTYCVYENQRWNPLTGYTSTGLPTDRYMWSDVTGRHKRTREHTKLLNRHWHWVSN